MNPRKCAESQSARCAFPGKESKLANDEQSIVGREQRLHTAPGEDPPLADKIRATPQEGSSLLPKSRKTILTRAAHLPFARRWVTDM
jgi:hypothetical protein